MFWFMMLRLLVQGLWLLTVILLRGLFVIGVCLVIVTVWAVHGSVRLTTRLMVWYGTRHERVTASQSGRSHLDHGGYPPYGPPAPERGRVEVSAGG